MCMYMCAHDDLQAAQSPIFSNIKLIVRTNHQGTLILLAAGARAIDREEQRSARAHGQSAHDKDPYGIRPPRSGTGNPRASMASVPARPQHSPCWHGHFCASTGGPDPIRSRQSPAQGRERASAGASEPWCTSWAVHAKAVLACARRDGARPRFCLPSPILSADLVKGEGFVRHTDA
jgi:hypothetical protein